MSETNGEREVLLDVKHLEITFTNNKKDLELLKTVISKFTVARRFPWLVSQALVRRQLAEQSLV